MFEILNKYSKEKVVPLFEHSAHYKYSVEEAIVDLINLDSVRINIALLSLFNQVKNWNKLYSLAKKHKNRRNVGLCL